MIKKPLVFLSLLAVSTIVSASPFNDGFAKGKVKRYVQNLGDLAEGVTLVKKEGMKGKYCLRLSGWNPVATKLFSVPVTPGRKYKISFRTKFENDETIENNPTLELGLGGGGRGDYIPWYRIGFLAANGKAAWGSPKGGVPYGKWKKFSSEFRIPPKITEVQLQFYAGLNNGALYVDDVKFQDVKSTPGLVKLALNPNITVKGEKLYYSHYGASTELFPLKSDSKYTIRFDGVDAWGFHGVSLFLYDANLKPLGKRIPLKDPLNKDMPLKTPKGTKWGKFLIYNHVLRGITLKQVK